MTQRRLSKAIAVATAALSLSAQKAPERYAEGQVWEYRTRTQDPGSLLKIQRITKLNSERVYHISVIGVRFKGAGIAGVLPHMPVSKATLDSSVMKRSSSTALFPTTAVDEGIAEWRRAQGGVFNIPLAQIIEIVDEQTSRTNAEL